MNNVKQKFATFYNSIKQFAFNAELSVPENIIGSDLQSIENLEKELGIKLPDFLFSFFEHFGEKLEIARSEEMLNLTMKDFKKAYLDAKSENINERLIDKNGLKDYWGEDFVWHISKLFNVDNILVIIYNSLGDCYGFIDTTIENPTLGYIYQKNYFESEGNTFSNYLRNVLFDVIQYSLKEEDYSMYNDIDPRLAKRYLGRQKSTLALKIGKISWAEYYFNIVGDDKYFFYKDQRFIDLRQEFYSLTSKMEAENHTILTIDEFEFAFIDFLKERDFKATSYY